MKLCQEIKNRCSDCGEGPMWGNPPFLINWWEAGISIVHDTPGETAIVFTLKVSGGKKIYPHRYGGDLSRTVTT
jgi:hypothetical protein